MVSEKWVEGVAEKFAKTKLAYWAGMVADAHSIARQNRALVARQNSLPGQEPMPEAEEMIHIGDVNPPPAPAPLPTPAGSKLGTLATLAIAAATGLGGAGLGAAAVSTFLQHKV